VVAPNLPHHVTQRGNRRPRPFFRTTIIDSIATCRPRSAGGMMSRLVPARFEEEMLLRLHRSVRRRSCGNWKSKQDWFYCRKSTDRSRKDRRREKAMGSKTFIWYGVPEIQIRKEYDVQFLTKLSPIAWIAINE